MRGLIFAATAAAAVVFVGALGAFASLAGAVRWQAFERPVARPGRIPAVEAPEEPIVTAMTASDVDSVPEALEARPRPAPEPAPRDEAAALGDVAPRAPKAKAAPRKTLLRKPSLFRRVGLGRARQTLQVGGGAGFDGGGSGAYSEAAQEYGGTEEEAPGAPAPVPGKTPVRARQFRAVTPTRGTVAPPSAPVQEEGGGDEEFYEEE